ncbi:MAG: hypothetical protein C4570_03825 [Ammonifex sp.]|jgi:hypothetical protein|nr:MAG: hypothetical protein C4570_03825 [Ammonifex sp.]
MDKLDQRIREALEDEERQILENIGQEQSLARQALGLFKGRTGWLNGSLLFGHVVFTIAGVYAAWRFFGITDVLMALRWGLSAAALLLAAVMTRIALVRAIQTNRVLRAVKDLEMRVAILTAKC